MIKPVVWLGSAKSDLIKLPPKVKANFGYALYEAQIGKYPEIAKTLSGFGGASVVELIEDDRGDTFRAVYAVKFPSAIFVSSCLLKEEQKRNICSQKRNRVDALKIKNSGSYVQRMEAKGVINYE